MNILEFAPLKNMIRTTKDMWLKGWNEKNGGNISLRVNNDDLSLYIDFDEYIKTFKLDAPIPKLANQNFIVTGKGKFFRNIETNPEENLGLIRISEDGSECYLIWGFKDGCEPTSDLYSHLNSHCLRQQLTNNTDRVVIHCHTSNLIALSSLVDLNTEKLTRALWETISEASINLSQGIGFLPWMLLGSSEIGHSTAQLMMTHPIVLWAHHGVFASGKNLDEAFGLIETAEKAAEILIKIISSGKAINYISEENILRQAKHFNINLYEPAIKIGEVIKTL